MICELFICVSFSWEATSNGNVTIDYEIVENAYGFGEKMMVLYNMDKIKNIILIKPTDKITNYIL